MRDLLLAGVLQGKNIKMSEGFQEFVKWIVIVVVIISVYNLVSGKTPYASYDNNSAPKTYRTTIIVGDQSATTFRNW